MTRYKLIFILFFIGVTQWLRAQPAAESVKQWQDQKFSMFIHFGGIYSVLGGVWDGKPVSRGLSEQIQAHAGIYSDTYANLAKNFNPVNWNADSIALLAKAAGMRSIVLTSKHHDGFCMFKTTTTDFNVVDATPFKRDVVKEMAEACKRHGLRFGLYFSLIDWHYPQASPISSHNSDYITPEHHAYNKKQVTELLTNYGTISELWFDMGSQSPAQSRELYQLVHRLQPDCMVSSRLGNDQGDFAVMGDNQYPDYAIGTPWQSPASFFDETWGYRSWQVRGSEDDKYKEKLESLIRVISRGGNYLLNIGPKGDGSVVGFEKNVLLRIGAWLRKNADAVYGTTADPFFTSFNWGNVTAKPGKLYLFVTRPPAGGLITLPGLEGKINSVSVLGGAQQLSFKQTADTAKITLPVDFDLANDIKVIAVDIAEGYKVRPAHIIVSSYDHIKLDEHNAYNYYSSSGIDYNSNYRSTVKQSWTVKVKHKGKYLPTIKYTDEEKGNTIDLAVDGAIHTLTLDSDRLMKYKPDTAKIKWGPLYITGPYYSGLGGLNGSADKIDITKPYTPDAGKPWQLMDNYKNGQLVDLPAGMDNAHYILQNINAGAGIVYAQVKITSGDGIVVLLNGRQLLINNNPDKAASVSHVIGLVLMPGNNQLLIKVFNNFKKAIPFAISHSIPQHIYIKDLDPVVFDLNKLYPVSLKLHNPPSPHQTMKLPNLEIWFAKK
ncbi:alpha-L-fucosidase [Mucilaginibacter oryzae]|uniref:alpha-L-fucosidase n=1 Tax=Mucilaginibacter oryzae TaxID=468058 RepID=A0A316HJ99_9SPHI|nr:alpha-L-fucosidase [Mucilaginibacter oryzae]PWK80121.1 alpha-L-fucosidase [Mucilaginibacter oryzae]